MNMIPIGSNMNNYNNQIKIKLTNDNKCIIQTLSESPIKSQNTIIKDELLLNDDMSLSKSNSIINNNSKTKKISTSSNKNNNINIFNDIDNNSNLLISFSNISEVGKINNDLSINKINSYKNNSILMNKDNISNINNNNYGGGNSFLSNQMQIMTGDKNVTINNINNYNFANSDGNSVISNNNFFISNEKNSRISINNDNINNTNKTPLKNNILNNIITSNKKKTNNNTKSINRQLINSFNKYDLSEISLGIINLNIDDNSENYDKVNMVYSDKKSFNTSNNLNSTTSLKNPSNNISPRLGNNNIVNNKSNNIKFFKNCIIQKSENINIIQSNPQKNNKSTNKKDELNRNIDKKTNIINRNIVPNHCANFTFCGIYQNNNNKLKELEINKNNDNQNNKKDILVNNNNIKDNNDDYVSPTFNLNLNYNSLDKNNNNNYNNINTIECLKDKENKNNKKVNDNNINNNINNINNNTNINNIIIKQKERNSIGPSFILKSPIENSNGSTIEVTDKTKKEIIKKNINDNNHKIGYNNINMNNICNNNILKNIKQQEKNLTNSNLNSRTNTNSKQIKENENNVHYINSQKYPGNFSNNINNLNSDLNTIQTKGKRNIIINNYNKTNHINKNNITNKDDISNNNFKAHKNANNINNQNNEKCNHIIVCKKVQNSRYKHPNGESINFNYNNLKNLYCSMTESDKKYQKLSTSHNKSKSGAGSVIKFQAHDNNIFNIKSGNSVKGNNKYNFKKFKSISPTIQRRIFNTGGVKEKYKIKSKSQSRSKTKSKNKYNKNELNEINYLYNTGKYITNTIASKQKSFKEKMDIILSKNIIALTKKIRKSPSPKIRISRPSFMKNTASNPKDKILENIKHNNNFGNNIYYNGVLAKKNKNSPSPLSFTITNNNTNFNHISYISNTNYNNKKSNMDNLLLINNNKKSGSYGRKKVIGSSPKYALNQNSSEHYDKLNDKICYQSSSSNKKKNFPFKIRANYGGTNSTAAINTNKNQKCQNKKLKNISNINRKNMNTFKYDDDYNSLNEKKKNINIILKQGINKKNSNSKNNHIVNKVYNNNIIINDINKKNNIVVNNIKTNYNHKKQMTIIKNFSKYKKKGSLNINNINNINNFVKNNCHNENICNNNFDDNKIISVVNERKNKNLNLKTVSNKNNEDKKKKKEYNHSQPKINSNISNFYTN